MNAEECYNYLLIEGEPPLRPREEWRKWYKKTQLQTGRNATIQWRARKLYVEDGLYPGLTHYPKYGF
jgi:hypothetical protein